MRRHFYAAFLVKVILRNLIAIFHAERKVDRIKITFMRIKNFLIGIYLKIFFKNYCYFRADMI